MYRGADGYQGITAVNVQSVYKPLREEGKVRMAEENLLCSNIFFISGVTLVYLQRHSDRGEQLIETLVKNIMWMVFIKTGKNH